MSLLEFTAGYRKTVLRTAFVGLATLKRDLTPDDITTEMRTVILSGVDLFWNRYGAEIRAARGVPGHKIGASWHAGREMAMVRLRRKAAYDPDDWGADLAARMLTSTMQMRRIRIRVISGLLSAEEFDG